MRPFPPKRLLAILVPLLAVALWVGWGFSRSVRAGEPALRVATSVCEAHELRALQAEDPHLAVEIPPEFNIPWPTREACLSHAAAEDPATPGPEDRDLKRDFRRVR